MIKNILNNQYKRDKFILEQLNKLPRGSTILDAGAGSQRYRIYCDHLKYFAQDFGEVKKDLQPSFTALKDNYQYGSLDYKCDITNIPVSDACFDAVLCTEVFEHLPNPVAALEELVRVLRVKGLLILTFPSNCLRHFDPFFYYSGFSDNWARYHLERLGCEITRLEAIGDYYSWILVELLRSVKINPIAIAFNFFSIAYYAALSLNPSTKSKGTLCMGYHVVAMKKQ